jgi:hypothetical protein
LLTKNKYGYAENVFLEGVGWGSAVVTAKSLTSACQVWLESSKKCEDISNGYVEKN